MMSESRSDMAEAAGPALRLPPAALSALRQWVKAQDHPLSIAVYRLAKAARQIEIPVVPFLHLACYRAWRMAAGPVGSTLRILWWSPLFRTRLAGPAPRLYLYDGLPLIIGPLSIRLGKGGGDGR